MTAQLQPADRVNRRLAPAGRATGLIWLAVALVVILGVGGAVVWWAVHPRWTDNGYSLTHKCPPLLRGTSDANVDYADAFHWNGVSYWLVPRAVVSLNNLGAQVTTIDCSIPELTAPNGFRVERDPWPDRTATFLPSGTPVFRIDHVKPTCQLAAKVEGQFKVYSPVDREDRRC